MPKKKGCRVKNDKRDAQGLAKALRNGDIVSVYVPSKSDEAVRDFIRMRDDFKIDLRKKKQQLLHCLLRHDIKYSGDYQYWSLKHRQWIKSLNLTEPLLNSTINEYYIAIVDLEDKLMNIEETRRSWELEHYFAVLPAFSGIYRKVDYTYSSVLSKQVLNPYNSSNEKPLSKSELTELLIANHLLHGNKKAEKNKSPFSK